MGSEEAPLLHGIRSAAKFGGGDRSAARRTKPAQIASLLEVYWECLQTVDEAGRAPAQRGRRHGQGQGREAGQQRPERDLALEPGQGSAEAVVDPVAEGHVTRRVPP